MAQYDPKGWVWDYGGYKLRLMQEVTPQPCSALCVIIVTFPANVVTGWMDGQFMLHVVDIRDAVNSDRFVHVQFDMAVESSNTSAAGRALVSPGPVEAVKGTKAQTHIFPDWPYLFCLR